MEIDSFAIEVCRLSLMLADHPNRNDWKLYNEDVFASSHFVAALKKADCVLCNPPFEDFTAAARKRYRSLRSVRQPAELLLRILDHAPQQLGFVLPSSFLSAKAYAEVNRILARNYGTIELLSLPDKIFRRSDAETVLLTAWNRRGGHRSVSVTCREVSEPQAESFVTKRVEPAGWSDGLVVPAESTASFSLWIPRLSQLWAYLSDYPTLSTYAQIHRGLEYEVLLRARTIQRKLKCSESRARDAAQTNRDRVFSSTPRKGFVRSVVEAAGLNQYVIKTTSYMSIDETLLKGNAQRRPWGSPKLLLNAARRSRGPWRLAAAYDESGLYAYQRLHGVWPRSSSHCLPLLALLNSPVANAFL